MIFPRPALRICVLLGLTLASCSAPGALPFAGASTRLVSPAGNSWDDAETARWALEHEVVFLGELHDSDPGHRRLESLFSELIEQAAAERRTLTLSLEMFERDVQDVLDDYLLGRISEEQLLEEARAWPNYAQHYRPLVELCRANQLDVIAANIPRRVARQVSKEGLSAVRSSLYAPRTVHADQGEYRDRMAALMLGSSHGDGDAQSAHGGPELSDSFLRLFQAQAIKDDAMAESIARFLDEPRARAEGRALVVHLCGRFHSDYHLGTVERLSWRRPRLSIGTLSMVDESEARGEDRPADVLLVLP